MAQPTAPQIEALTAAVAQARAANTGRVTAYAQSLYRTIGSGGWTRQADIDAFVAALTPKVVAGAATAAALTNAYIGAVSGQRPGQVMSTADLSHLRSGVSMEHIYTRPAVTYRASRRQGYPASAAALAGEQRLTNILSTDLQLAQTHQARFSMRQAGLESYRRQPGGSACQLCLAASSRPYRTADLMPIHPHCQCTVVPWFGSGSILDWLKEWAPLLFAAWSMLDEDSDAPVPVVQEHDEIGPILADADHHFTEMGDWELAPAPASAGAGNGGAAKPPAPPAPPSSSGRPEWQPEGETYWAARQAKLHTPTNGAQLTRSEVLFLEKFEALGEKAEWIPPTRAARTSDFYWTSRDGKPWELKSPSLAGWGSMTAKEQYERIAKRVSQDAPYKKNFLIDIGNMPLTNDLKWQLTQYNVRHSRSIGHMIEQLVVMANGQLYTIVLA